MVPDPTSPSPKMQPAPGRMSTLRMEDAPDLPWGTGQSGAAPAIALLQAGWREEMDPAGGQHLSGEHPLPHPMPQWEGSPETCCRLTVRGRPAKAFPFFSSTSLACR